MDAFALTRINGEETLDSLPISLPLEFTVGDPRVIAVGPKELSEMTSLSTPSILAFWPSVSPAARSTPIQSVGRVSSSTD
jgi:hypothetical protein